MHEMALAEGMLEIVESTARANGATKVKRVWLEIGALSHVAPDALLFCFDAVTRGSLAEGATLEIIATPGEGWCLDCSKTVAVGERFGPCPECGGYHVQVTSGEDMRVKELEVD